ncbi:MAG: M1 family metallopeptidase [Planctomycetes bacterium]|nr:M1 family metallopeptidase [Planctomycetota bacterium]
MTRAALSAFLLLAACSATGTSPDSTMDPHSHAEPHRVRVEHVELDLVLDFAARAVRGAVRLDLVRHDPGAPLVLDAQGLAIERVTGADGTERAFRLGAEARGLGGPLTIDLASGERSVRIAYHTTEHADALQWLEPAQTAGGRQPFLFTQGQAVLTRTWIPLQDSPGVRVTYAGRVRAPEGLTVLMSAEQLGVDTEGAFAFRMRRPIPPYLIALACGELSFLPISERSGVWAEPSIVERARAEFEDTESMLRAAEALFGPYRWGRYDLLVLPPSFPFGGMENPVLTFATPTILAGDKSLVSLVAHELAHSWSGNLVTNATWRDFWLNEGFTVYFENRIMERVFGAERALMEMQLERAELLRTLERREPWQHVLHIDLDDRHPDEGFSSIPYTKGALFLQALEHAVGRERFDPFLRRWFDEHAFQSVTSADFRRFLEIELLAGGGLEVDVEEWLTGEGLPADAPDPRSRLLTAVDEAAARWRQERSTGSLRTEAWSTQEWLHFLEAIADSADAASMADLDRRFRLTSSGNAEILCVWLRMSIQHGYAAADAAVERFLTDVGRRKFLEPLYRELAKTEAGLARARQIYARVRGRYHAVSRGTIDEVVGWQG